MERATKEIKTTGGHTAKFYDYMTAGEAQAMAALLPDNGTTAQNMEANNKAVASALLELNGTPDEILKRLLELPVKDFREISDAVQALVETDDKKK